MEEDNIKKLAKTLNQLNVNSITEAGGSTALYNKISEIFDMLGVGSDDIVVIKSLSDDDKEYLVDKGMAALVSNNRASYYIVDAKAYIELNTKDNE